jgi:hypothetical protein
MPCGGDPEATERTSPRLTDAGKLGDSESKRDAL